MKNKDSVNKEGEEVKSIKKTVKKTTKAKTAAKEESDNEDKPFPDFLNGNSDDEKEQKKASAVETKAKVQKEEKPAKVQESKKAPKEEKKAKKEAAPKKVVEETKAPGNLIILTHSC